MIKTFTLGAFLKKYKTDRDCLKEIVKLKYPNGIFCKKCKCFTKHYLLRTRPVLSCSICHHQTSPLVGTIFEKTTTPLTSWFYAMFLMIHSKGGISARNLQRQVGVSYDTAWRMLHQIRKLMTDDSEDLLTGTVEIDETWVGGKSWFRGKKWWQNWEERPKTIVWGVVERDGKVRTKIVPNTGLRTLTKVIKDNISTEAFIMSDQLPSYKNLHKLGYAHANINHSKKYVYEDIYTQNIENFWSHLKRGITGVYRHVSPKYLQAYCDEFSFRYNHRKEPTEMFDVLLIQAANSHLIRS